MKKVENLEINWNSRKAFYTGEFAEINGEIVPNGFGRLIIPYYITGECIYIGNWKNGEPEINDLISFEYNKNKTGAGRYVGGNQTHYYNGEAWFNTDDIYEELPLKLVDYELIPAKYN